MKKSLIALSAFIGIGLGIVFAQLPMPGTTETIYNKNINQVVGTEGLDDPLREGTYSVIDNENTRQSDEAQLEVNGIINVGQIDEHSQAKDDVLQIIKNIINYALGMLGFVALVYLIAHGFMIVTAAGDDEKYKQGLKGIKYAAIALGGIGISWFVISMVFWVIARISETA